MPWKQKDWSMQVETNFESNWIYEGVSDVDKLVDEGARISVEYGDFGSWHAAIQKANGGNPRVYSKSNRYGEVVEAVSEFGDHVVFSRDHYRGGVFSN